VPARRWCLGFVLSVLVVTFAFAQTPSTAEKRVALVIGNGAYASSPLRNPVNDARAMATTLRGLGFDVLAREDVTDKEMRRAILEFGDRLKGGGVGLFFFAGHGMQVAGRNFMIPIGAEIASEREVELEAVDVARVLARMEAANNRLNIVILDACRDSPFGRGFRSATRGLAPIDAPTGTIIAYATAPGRVARDGDDGNGLYTGELVKVLREPGLRLEEVFKRVRQAVRLRTAGEQVPWEASSVEGEFVFALPSGAGPAAAPTPPGARFDVREEVSQRSGSMALSSRLDAVEVFVDGERVGELKLGRILVVNKLPEGAHRVLGRKDGHKDWERAIQVTANQRTEVRIDIEKGDDGAEMVLVPAGRFWMGSDESRDEKPRHQVYLDAYHIDRYEVTNALYRRFAGATGRPPLDSWSDDVSNGPQQPAVEVSWDEADAYCLWASKRLPTEAEWEKAARGNDGRKYPWGDQWNTGANNSRAANLGKSAPVGSYPAGASPYGALDMAGNVWEWVADWYQRDYYSHGPDRNPPGPASGTRKVLRGGSWNDAPDSLRTSYRYNFPPINRHAHVGFRCVRTAMP